MKDFIPVICPICDNKLVFSKVISNINLLICDTIGCVYVNYTLDWDFTDFTFWNAGLFVKIKEEGLLFPEITSDTIPYPFSYQEFMEPARFRRFLKTLTIFM